MTAFGSGFMVIGLVPMMGMRNGGSALPDLHMFAF